MRRRHMRRSVQLGRNGDGRMYTGRKVTRVIQPVAFFVLLVLGGLPGVTLACQWACSGVAGSAQEQATHHHHSTEAPDSSAPALEAMSVVASEQPCEHAGTSVTALTAANVKVLPFVAIHVPQLGLSHPWRVAEIAAGRGVYSPPGARSAPLPLRI